MEDIPAIDIEGKQLALSTKELSRLTTSDGCQLQVVTDKVLKLEDDDGVDDEDEINNSFDDNNGDQFFVDDIHADSNINNRSKLDRKKREYISLVLNANNDPIKPGAQPRFKNFHHQDSSENNGNESAQNFDIINLKEKYLGIHQLYKDLGSYEEYMSKNPFVEIVPGLVYKMTRSPGAGKHSQVTEDSMVIYNCALWTENSKEPFDSTWLRRTTLVTHLSTDSILPGLRELLLTTQEREFCEAFFGPEVAFGPLGAMPRIPPNATVFCLLQVVRVVNQDKLQKLLKASSGTDTQVDNDDATYGSESGSGLNFEDFFEASNEARQRGNYYYEHDEYKVALQRYKSAIRLLEGFSYKNENQESQAKDLLVKLYNNCARTLNALGDPRGALGACKQASQIDDMVPKTYYHRMTAWAKKGHLDKALGVARRAIQLFPDQKVSKPFIRAAEEYKLRMQQEQVESDQLYRLMGRALVQSSSVS